MGHVLIQKIETSHCILHVRGVHFILQNAHADELYKMLMTSTRSLQKTIALPMIVHARLYRRAGGIGTQMIPGDSSYQIRTSTIDSDLKKSARDL